MTAYLEKSPRKIKKLQETLNNTDVYKTNVYHMLL